MTKAPATNGQVSMRHDRPRLNFSGVWAYAPAPEGTDLLDIKPRYGHFIDGDFVDAADGRTFTTETPAPLETIAECA